MPGFKLNIFSGTTPKIHPTLLPAAAATQAVDTRLDGGTVAPVQGPSAALFALRSATQPKTLWRYYSDFWFEFEDDVELVRPPVVDDPFDRVIFTGVAGLPPQLTSADIATAGANAYPTVAYDLGVPAPSSSPQTTQIEAEPDTAAETDSRYYVYTEVNNYGEEGPPSPLSGLLEVTPGNHVELSELAVTGGRRVTNTFRIYRTSSTATSADFFYVGETTSNNTTFLDTLDADQLSEVLETAEYDPPHAEMRGVVALPNGFLAGFFGNTLCFSEPGLPYAWPVRYRIPVESDIVALGVFGNNICVGTKAQPYLVLVTDPANASLISLELPQACVSRRSMLEVPGGVVYATPDGMALVTASGGSLLTEGVYTRAQWQALNPAQMRTYLWERKVLISTDATTLVFDSTQPSQGIVEWSFVFDAAYYDHEEDRLYVAVGTDAKAAGEGEPRTMRWKSRKFIMPAAMSMSAAKVLAESYPLTLEYYLDDVLAHTTNVTSAAPFRLPSTLANSIEVALAGTAEVYEVTVGSTMAVLASV
jgi:hypothetical protein